MLNLVSNAETAYWDVVAARENLKVAEGARNVAAEFLKLSQKQLELGALSPLDIYNPQQQLATNEVSVAQAKFNLTQREDALRKQIGADLDPQVRALPIVLTETVRRCRWNRSIIDREETIVSGDAESPRSQSRRRRTWTWTIFRSSSRAMPCCRICR